MGSERLPPLLIDSYQQIPITKEQPVPEDVARITVRLNGSLRVEGPFKLIDANGNEWDLGGKTSISLCRCGHSSSKPFCDGTHKTIGFEAPETATPAVETQK